MASKEWAIKQYGLTKLNGRDHYLEDGDTWVDVESGKAFRGKGFDTAETYHTGTKEDPIKSPATFRGYGQTKIVADMMQNKGFNTQEEDGVGYYGRTLGVVSNPDTEEEIANKLHLEGLVDPTAYSSAKDMDAFYGGMATRAALGIEANNGYYGDKRDLLESLSRFDTYTPKTIALNESQYGAKDANGNSRSFMYNDVMYRHLDRSIDNKARSAFSTGFGSGIDSLQQGYWGVVEMTGNKFGSDYLEALGSDNVEANQLVMDSQPIWVNDVSNIDSVASFADWASGSLGGSLPYFMLMAAGFIPGMVMPVGAAMGLTYAGQTWNEMKGANDEKSAFTALTTGVVMAAFERLGGVAVLKGLQPKDLLNEKGIKKAIERLTAPQRDASGKFAKKKLTTAEARKMIAGAKEAEMLAILKQFGENKVIWQAYAKRVGLGTAAGFVGEASTEGAQEAAQYIGAHLGSEEGKSKWDWDELQGRLTNATLAGGMLGGGIRGAGSAVTNTSPLHTGLRDRAWNRMVAQDFDESDPLNMHRILDKAGQAHIKESTEEIIDENGNKVTKHISNAEENDAKVSGWIDKHDEKQKNKSTLGRSGEVITEFEWLSSGYQVLKSRLGDAYKSSKTLLAEFDLSGFIDGRVAHGLKLPQLKRKLQGIQHAGIHNVTQHVANTMKFGNTKKGRAKAYDMLQRYLKQRGGALDKEFKDNQAVLEQALDGILHVERQIYHWVRRAEGQKSKYNPLPYHTLTERHLSIDKVEARKEKYVDILMEKYDFSRVEAEEEFDKIIRTPQGYDYKSYADSSFLTRKPTLLKNTLEYDNEVWEDFWQDNTYETVQERATEVANYIGDTITMGFGGNRLNSKILQIDKELREAHGDAFADENMPEIASTIYRQYQAHRGEFHKIQNDKARIALSNVGSLMSLAYMPLAVWSSLPEIGLAFLNADKDMLFKAINGVAKKAAQHMAKQMNNIAGTDLSIMEYEAGLDALRRRGMLTHEYGVGHVVDAEYGNDRRNWMQEKLMPRFYQMTGLTGFTSAMRVIRDGIGNDFIGQQLGILELVLVKRETDSSYEMNNKEARAFTKMKELGVNPLDLAKRFHDIEKRYERTRGARDAIAAREILKKNAKVNKLSKERVKTLTKQASYTFDKYLNTMPHPDVKSNLSPEDRAAVHDAFRLANDIDLARSNFVDAALVNPDPGKRPLFYSDGRFRLLTLFQGYLSVFSATIIKPILKDMAGKGSPADQMNAAAMMLTMIGLGFLGQAIKDEIKYGDKPSWLTDAEYLQRGILASGLMGQTERIFNLFFPLYHSKEDTLADKAWGEVGPLAGSIDSIQKGIHWATEGESERSLNKFLKVAPLGALTQQRKWIASTIAGE